MIEFNGYISGTAEMGFVRKSRKIFLAGAYITILLALPMVFLIGNVFQKKSFIFVMGGLLMLLPLMAFIPKSKKEQLKILPKRIYTDGEVIVCIADTYTDTKFINDVKEVIDHGEYYELSFVRGKTSEKFICQKNLLTQGSLRGFEALFKGKITRANIN